MRVTSKANEIDRHIRQITSSVKEISSALRTSKLKNRVLAREKLIRASNETKNLEFYAHLDKQTKQTATLSKLKTVIDTLLTTNEAQISAEVAKANDNSELSFPVKKISRLITCTKEESSYSVYTENGKLKPLYYMRFSNVVTENAGVIPSYTLWFKSGIEFCSGFSPFPPCNWRASKGPKHLLSDITALFAEDGINL